MDYPMEFFLSQLIPFAFLALTYYLAWRFVRAYEARSSAPSRLEGLAQRVRALEEGFEQVTNRVDDVADGQRFTTRVLLGGSSAPHAMDALVRDRDPRRRSLDHAMAAAHHEASSNQDSG